MGFGRVLRDDQDRVLSIVEEDQATPEQRAITELNAGVYCFDAAWLWPHLAELPVSPRGEFFLTDTIAQAVAEGQIVESVAADSIDEVMGVNTRVHLADVERVVRDRIRRDLMLAGVTMVDPTTVYADAMVEVGADTVLYPNTILEGATRIGPDCLIGPGSRIVDSVVGGDAGSPPRSWSRPSLRTGCRSGRSRTCGPARWSGPAPTWATFRRSRTARWARAATWGTFSYLGDAVIGQNVNVSAGTITCNYDGARKHRTEVGDDAFLGSDTLLVAPVTVGAGAQTGAGAVVTRDVADGELVVGVPARPRRRRPAAQAEG